MLDAVRAHWRAAKSDGAAPLVAEIDGWQKALWRFTSVGHIGKVGGPKAWQEPVDPLVTRAGGAAEAARAAGSEGGHAVSSWPATRATATRTTSSSGSSRGWSRLAGPILLLRDVRDFTREMTARRERLFASTAKALEAAAEAGARQRDRRCGDPRRQASGRRRCALGVARLPRRRRGGGIAARTTSPANCGSSAGYDFVKGWGSSDTPSLVANSSDKHVRIPGNMKPHGVCVHPSPTLHAAVGWRSPIAGSMRDRRQGDARPPRVRQRRDLVARSCAAGQRGSGWPPASRKATAPATIGPIEALAVQPGDLVSLLIGPRDGNHACDLTDVELVLTSNDKKGDGSDPSAPRQWSLARDVSGDVLAGNPHADRFGNEGVWHFYTEPVQAGDAGPVIPAGSLLARWQAARQPAEKQTAGRGDSGAAHPTARPPMRMRRIRMSALYRQLASLGRPAVRCAHGRVPMRRCRHETSSDSQRSNHASGLDPALFGKHPDGSAIDAASLVRAGAVA